MIEILQNFERAAANYGDVMLIAVGLACVVLGLFVWLNGLNFRKILVTFIGAVIGGFGGYFFAGPAPLILAGSIVTGAVIAFVLERLVITLFSATLATALAIGVLANTNLVDAAGLKDVIANIHSYNWIIIAVIPIVLIAGGILVWRLTSALFYASGGTVLIFAGMILLLIYKGSMPISAIIDRQLFYAAVITAMIAFGTIVQLFLCGKTRTKSRRKKEKNND